MTSFWLLPLLYIEYSNPDHRKAYTKANILNLKNLKNLYLSSIGSTIWFTTILFTFDYTPVSHAILLGNLANFFLSILRTFKVVYLKR
jgi:hypothetical protein